jgi:hypothetical protein
MIKFECEAEDLPKLLNQFIVKPEENLPTVLCLRTVNQDGTAYNNFKWPTLGFVEAPDWEPTEECGNGLHGYLKGCGNAEQIKWNGLFQVVKVIEKEIVQLDGKVKFPRCEVIFTGSQKEATDILQKEYPGLPIIGATVVVGDNLVAVSGVRGTATAGNNGTATAGEDGTATAGDEGKATAGGYGTATAGDNGTATAGDFGTATVGNGGTATAGYYGTATAGEYGRLSILYWDNNAKRYREIIGYVGENGIEPNIAYKLNDQHEFVKA